VLAKEMLITTATTGIKLFTSKEAQGSFETTL
jgi:hypothetical protein